MRGRRNLHRLWRWGEKLEEACRREEIVVEREEDDK
jgi:hypothetical protein